MGRAEERAAELRGVWRLERWSLRVWRAANKQQRERVLFFYKRIQTIEFRYQFEFDKTKIMQ
jgi:hypothetical protein